MLENQQFARPIDDYKAIIDKLVTKTSHGVHERLVVEVGIWSKVPPKTGGTSKLAWTAVISDKLSGPIRRLFYAEPVAELNR